MKERSLALLRRQKLRKTPFRIEVLNLFLNHQTKGLSSSTIEASLPNFDRITLYRTLKTFEKSGLIHIAIDSSDEKKYALCHEDCSEHNHLDDHAHFLCNACGETSCLANVMNPIIKLPDNYKLDAAHLALSGICADCNLDS